jgi:hypothetical protein
VRRFFILAALIAALAIAGLIGFLANSGQSVSDPPPTTPALWTATTATTATINASLPPGATYAQVQARVLAESRISERAADAAFANASDTPIASVDCVLTASWLPGSQFTCATVGSSGSQNGTSTVSIESPNPGQPFTILVSWQPVGLGP